jgi:hypothetical protein
MRLRYKSKNGMQYGKSEKSYLYLSGLTFAVSVERLMALSYWPCRLKSQGRTAHCVAAEFGVGVLLDGSANGNAKTREM